MSKLLSKKWWKKAGERAIKTVAQTIVASIPVSAAMLSDINWAVVASTAVLAGIVSILTSIATVEDDK